MAKKPGRPPKFDEPLVERKLRLPESLDIRLRAAAREAHSDDVDVARAALESYLSETAPDTPAASKGDVKAALREVLLELGPQIVRASELKPKPRRGKAGDKTGTVEFFQPRIIEGSAGLVAVKMLAAPPCGPWKEAIEQAEEQYISSEMAARLKMQPGDFFVQADGQSMEGAGIADGALLLMRPLNGKKPAEGAVTLICVETTSGQWVGTIKHWHTTPKGNPDLRDGRGFPYYPPENTKVVHAVAVKVGMISVG